MAEVAGEYAGTSHAQSLPLSEQLEVIAGRLRCLDESAVRDEFALDMRCQLLKTTIGLCDRCLQHVPGAVYAEDGRVFMARRCDQHGLRRSLLENDQRFYRLSSKDHWGRRYAHGSVVELPAYASCCGGDPPGGAGGDTGLQHYTDQMHNKSCTVLVEITDACNLACRVCYADSRGDRILPLATFKRHMLALIRDKGTLDSVQITGGEASLHPEFWDMVAWLYACDGVRKIYLPTNGIELSRGDVSRRLVPYRDKLLVLLQFDGVEVATNRALRAANPLKPRMRLVKALDRHRIAMQFTMTLAHGVSEKEIAWVIRQGVKHRHVRLIGMLPAFYSGRYELDFDPLNRLTLSDVVKGAAAGLPARMRAEDFLPIPCSHPNCGWTTLFVRRFGAFFNIARHVNVNAVMKDVAYKTVLDRSAVQRMVGTRYAHGVRRMIARIARRLVRPRDVFGIAIKPFMDRFNYDQDRVSACCHHMLDTKGQLVSFCEYNALARDTDSWQQLPRLTRQPNIVRLEGIQRG